MLLSELIKGTDIDCRESFLNVEFIGISCDSRGDCEGRVFVSLNSKNSDCVNYAKEAQAKGATLYIGENYIFGLGIPQLITENARRTASQMYANFYSNPQKKLRIIGITGTNGKTTTAFMLKTILSHGGYKTALIGTVKCMIGEKEYIPPVDEDAKKRLRTMTTPDPDILYLLMSDMVKEGVEILVMEVSSHALALEKLAPVHFDIGVFTNLSEEHLDFHSDMDEYLAAKARLFDNCSLAVINADDRYGEKLEKVIKCSTVFYGINNKKGYYAENIIMRGSLGSEYVLHSDNSRFKIKTVIPGRFNLYNTMAAAVAARKIGVNLITVQNAIYAMNGIHGRLERVRLGFGGADISVFLDYAHTPFALENLLECVNGFREQGQRILTLFGCGGDRDREKRAVMGKIATRMSDFVVITADNSRSEDPCAIIEDILKGVGDAENYIVIEDRQSAIEYAIKNAIAGDIILLVGKGHEQYEIDKYGLHPFSESEIAQKAAKMRKV